MGEVVIEEPAPTGRKRKNGNGGAVATVDPAALPAARTPMEMIAQLVERGGDIAVIERLMTLHERHEANEARRAYDEAMTLAQAEFDPVVKDRTGNNKTKYASLAALTAAVVPALLAHGFRRPRYEFGGDERDISVTCIVRHQAGHEERNTARGPRETSGNKNALQAVGSSYTYLRRYSLEGVLGLAPEPTNDDDGHAAGRYERDEPERQPERKPEPAPKREPVTGPAAQQVVEMYAGQLREAKTGAQIAAVCDEFTRNYRGRMNPAHLAKIEEIANAELARIEGAHGDAYYRLAAELRACKTRGEVVALGNAWAQSKALDGVEAGQRDALRALFAKLKAELPETAPVDPIADVLAYFDGLADVDAIDAALLGYKNGKAAIGEAPAYKSLGPADVARILDHAAECKRAIGDQQAREMEERAA